jgi:hypothetical protein
MPEKVQGHHPWRMMPLPSGTVTVGRLLRDGREGGRPAGGPADLAGRGNAAVMLVLFLVFGVLLAGQGIAGLS